MNHALRNKTRLALIASLGIMPLIAACGGGEGEAESPGDVMGQLGTTGGGSTNCNLVILVITAGYICEDTSSSQPPAGNPSGNAGSPGPDNSDSSIPVQMNRVAEYEPNGILDNANPVQFRIVSGDTLAGIEITGSVQDDTDRSDFFILTPNRSGSYAVYLCAETCSEQVIDDTVYLMVFDQNQTTIASTPIATVEEQMLVVPMTAGLAYYVEVHGYNTAATPYEYRLVIIE